MEQNRGFAGQQHINYQKCMEDIIACETIRGRVPRLLLHSCCAPCSSYCLMTLAEYFEVTVFYYNPNIYPEEEYRMRAREQARFIEQFPVKHPVSFLEGAYDTARFYEMAKGLEQEPEGGKRCFACYELRLRETAEMALQGGYDYFTTTLSISPLKNAQKLNEIGAQLAQEYGIAYLFSDFKKKDGYKKSTEISREYGMYRQNYCGCVYSLRERQQTGNCEMHSK